MRVHPVPKKRTVAFRHGPNASFSVVESNPGPQKRLRRLPHVFSKVLELPFRAEADVSVIEGADCFRFVALASGGKFDGGVRAHAIQIHPGVTKVVIRKAGGDLGDDGEVDEELELDRWRFRLPQSTLPAMAKAEYADGELVVTVPKDPGCGGSEAEDGGDSINGDPSRVLAQ
ncbi:hypothetical protein HPP92_009612 [Vanilla planifolia]|uniref:SHSP domain-containing protein n=1 Tax=Vanilla planifolia TaxID=51239 RepID=A0A835R876_VANPL|nr:hypothetical protein HPP92_009612 [Vanilla planifolia]